MSRDGNLRQLFKARLPQIFWTPIETGLTMSGVPDHYGIIDGVSFWVEYKGISSSGWVIPWRPEQIGWHSRLARHGGRSFIAVRRTTHEDVLWLLRGNKASQCYSLREVPAAALCGRWAGGPKLWDWGAVVEILRKAKT